MNLNLNQLKIFFFCGQHQTFSEAAKALFLSQPAVTMQIKQLEAHLGIELFQRRGKTTCLTNAGHVLFEYARKIFELTEAAENAVKELKDLKAGDLRIGTLYIYARFMMPPLISAYQTEYPGVRLVLDEGSSTEIIQSLMDYKNELGLIAVRSHVSPQLRVIPYCQDELVLVLAGDHPLNEQRSIRLEDLAKESLIIQREGALSREFILNKYQEAGIEPRTLVEARNLAFIIEQVQAGKGISFTSAWAFKDQLERGTLKIRTLVEGPFLINVGIAYLKNRLLSPAAQAFVELVSTKRSAIAADGLTIPYGIGSLQKLNRN